MTPDRVVVASAQKRLVATIVHNAGIYSGIVAGDLFWAAFGGNGGTDVARVMRLGALVDGVFGAATLRSSVPAVQAIVGLIGLISHLKAENSNSAQCGV
jgi:uncharacterized membrane protein